MLNLSRYHILAIGKLRKLWIKEGLSIYLKRLPGLAITELRESNPQQEAKVIHNTVKKNELLITLSEEGEALSSLAFAERLQKLGNERLVFVIGGADGLSPEVKDSSAWSLSLSPLTFPHEIARLLLVEQLYRAQTILQQGPYHRF